MSALQAHHRAPTGSVQRSATGTIVGISAYFHDSAACLLRDGVIVAAAQEERFSRRKHDNSLPLSAYRWCLAEAGLTPADVECVAYYEDPATKLERQLSQFWPVLSPERCVQLWQAARRPLDDIRQSLGFDGEVDVYDHHQSHAASAFYFSGFPEAAILTVDGVGEWATTTYGRGGADGLTQFEAVQFPHSLGLLYSTITSYLGFAVNDGEYKVMGLAAYGRPRYADRLWSIVTSEGNGQFRLNQAYFDFTGHDRMHADALADLLGASPRRPDDPIATFHEDLASSVQHVLERILLEKVRYLHDRVPVDALCMAGGVALNCVANGRIVREGPFDRLFVQPAAGDAGGALGAAALAHARRHRAPIRALTHVYLGPAYSAADSLSLFREAGIAPADYQGDEAGLVADTVERLIAGQVVAWFQGRMEFGPRALGARSILADPRSPTMRDRINALIKEREPFRPFAPAVMESMVGEHFDLNHASPFMLETCSVTSPLPLPAITHVDGTARVQTVDGRTHRRFGHLLSAFRERTGCPLLLNTSFNLRDEPIVTSPADALATFARSRIDTLVVEDFVVDRSQLTPALLASGQEHAVAADMIPTGAYTF